MSKSRFGFTEEFDLHLARDIYGQNPYEDPKRWNVIQVNMIQITGKSVNIRTLKDRIQNLVNKYLVKAESLKGKSGIEILVSEIDDLLQQIVLMISENQKKICSTTKHPSAIESKTSYQDGFQAREEVCATLVESDLSTDKSEGSFLLEPEMIDVTNFIDIENTEPIEEHESESIPSPIVITKKRPLAQAHIMAPNRKRSNPNLKETTVKYLEKKNKTHYEIRSREVRLQERKQTLEENKFEMDRQKRQKKLEIEERRLEMEERRLKVQMDLFANQQEMIRLLFNENSDMYKIVKKFQVYCSIRSREVRLQERKQTLEENKFEMDRQERQKKLEIEERRLEMEERRLKVQMDLFANQQEMIRLLFNKNSDM